MTLKTYNPKAGEELLEAEEDYYHSAGKHFEQGIFHTTHQAPDDIEIRRQLYLMQMRRLVYAHFKDAAHQEKFVQSYNYLENLLPEVMNTHVDGMRLMELNQIRRVNKTFLPTVDIEDDPFLVRESAEVKSQIVRFENTNGPYNTEAMVTLKRTDNGSFFSRKKSVSICFSHVAGSVGCSPMNALERIAEQTLEGELKRFKLKDIRFFIHVPPEAAGQSTGEMFIEHELERGRRGLNIVERTGFDKKPICLDQFAYDHFPKPEEIESSISRYFNMSDDQMRSEGVYDKVSTLGRIHAAQVHRRFVLANKMS